MPNAKLPLIQADPWLEPYARNIEERVYRFWGFLRRIELEAGSLLHFANAHTYLGINYDHDKKGWFYREWAPAAEALSLVGDFNQWDSKANPMVRNGQGVWEVFLDQATYHDRFTHESLIKVRVKAQNGENDRIPAYSRRVVQNPVTHDFSGQLWMPPKPYQWRQEGVDLTQIKEPLIYECHVGMAQEKEGVGSYLEFAEKVLPRAKALGYNVIQLMAVHEHPYYGSFGYHVSSFFAPSSRFGTPDELKQLIDTAHGMGIAVVMDVVHSHAVKNFHEGLNNFDGSGHQYFHADHRGDHPGWDSKLFDYGKVEVLQFLLSNLRYWMEEFCFDGFRFDGVTSMLYTHHGFTSFDHYDKYFGSETDQDAIRYLQLANTLIHQFRPGALSIAEDVSGMPGLSRPVEEGGIGFDYRLGMGIPDYWIKLLKDQSDEEWNIHDMWGTLNNRRAGEKTIAYAESHDQALVGDKTIAFRLMDKEMYFHMLVTDNDLVIDRGLALHKMIRLFTVSLGGEGYMTFMGNEFGHPEWIDFPREGNNWSYKYARRMWSLVENQELKYKFFDQFEREMIALVKEYHILSADPARQLNMDDMNKVIIFERSNLVFVFNFHFQHSIFDYKFYVPTPGKYRIILNSDEARFGGHNRVDSNLNYFSDAENFLRLYITNRTVMVLRRFDD
ncbi:MAG: alpha amylase C-terminal domain-containing protein [Bacteroidota bacterium]